MPVRTTLLVIVLAWLLPLTARAEQDIRIAVMEFASKGGVSQKQMDALSDLLANEIRGMGKYRVIGKSDIRTALDIETQKNLVGCNDESCIAEIGGALGVRWVIVGNISKFGDKFLLNLKIMDAEKIRVVKGVSQKVEGGEGELLDALSIAAKELIEGARPEIHPGEEATKPVPDKPAPDKQVPDKPIVSDTKPSLPPPTIEEAAPSSTLSTWGHITFWSGVGLTVLGIAGTAGGVMDANKYADYSLQDSERLAALNSARDWTTVMWIGYGTGFALMATGAALWIFDAMSESAPQTSAAVAPTLDGQGLVLTLGGRW
jgi:TolB-like protein